MGTILFVIWDETFIINLLQKDEFDYDWFTTKKKDYVIATSILYSIELIYFVYAAVALC